MSQNVNTFQEFPELFFLSPCVWEVDGLECLKAQSKFSVISLANTFSMHL